MSAAEAAWNKVRDKESDPEYSRLGGDAKARLNTAIGEVSQGRSSGIAGLEKFEEEVKKHVEVQNQPTSTVVSVTDSSVPPLAATAGAEAGAAPQPKGTGAQKGGSKVSSEEKAQQDAAGAQQKVISDEVNSPDYPSAARPLAAEVPGTAPAPAEESGKKGSRSKAGASKKSGATKKSAKKSSSKK